MSKSAFNQAQSPYSSEAVPGLVRKATEAEVEAGEDTGPNGEPLYLPPSQRSIVSVEEFFENGVWEKPERGTFALIEVWGAGASGGVARGSAVIDRRGANGGGGGEYRSFLVPFVHLVQSSYSITIGIGGAAINSVNSNGNDGGDTTFGSIVLAKGGRRGTFWSDVSSGTVPSVLNNDGDSSLKIEAAIEKAGNLASWNTGGSPSTPQASTYAAGTGGAAKLDSFTNGAVPAYSESGKGGNGAGSLDSNVQAEDGQFPGGGGGAAVGVSTPTPYTVISGKGGDGFVRVTVF